MRKYIIAICAALAGITICTTFLISTTIPKNPDPAEYKIYVYPDGSAQIKLNSVNEIIQTHKDIIAGNVELKAGTIILPGNGNPVYYDYIRRDYVLKEK